MKTTKYSEQEIKDTPHKLDVRVMYDKETAQANILTIKPGESLNPHKTPVDVFFFVLDGNPSIHIGDETQVCEKDTLIESPKDIVHYISNNSDKAARVLIVKAPKPSASKIL